MSNANAVKVGDEVLVKGIVSFVEDRSIELEFINGYFSFPKNLIKEVDGNDLALEETSLSEKLAVAATVTGVSKNFFTARVEDIDYCFFLSEITKINGEKVLEGEGLPFIEEIGRIIQEAKELTSQIKSDEESKVVSDGINFIKIMTGSAEDLLEEVQLEGIEQE